MRIAQVLLSLDMGGQEMMALHLTRELLQRGHDVTVVTMTPGGTLRGEFRFGNNQYPIQDYYLRTIGRDSQGRITNRTLNKVFTNHQDTYASQCAMK